ncbi:MAG TPA: tetratricopeptide repeat protein, partial [Lachnospiraceae bacterium]|nr:tetratricopeptide repeat protein [Lachnospiraceae bacterium]
LCICMAFLLNGCEFAANDKDNTTLGMEALEALDYSTALDYFEAALAAGEDQQLVCRGQGMAYLGLAQYTDAITAFEKALAQSDGRVHKIEYDISYYLAVAEYKNGDLDAAYDTYSSILSMNEKDADAWYLRGKVQLAQGEKDAAVADFEQAVELEPENYDLYIKIYEDLAEADDTSDGEAYISRAMENNEKMSDYQVGIFSYYLGNYEDARNYLEKARESDDSKELVLYLGKTYEALGDVNYAVSLYTAFLDKDQQAAAVYNQLGLAQMELADYEDALTAFENGIALEDITYMQSLKFNEIVAYEYLTEFKKAAVQMEEYLKLYPDDEKALREYEFLKTR